jgi:hypothetical protein
MMRTPMLVLVLGLFSVLAAAQTSPSQDSQNNAQRPTLQMVKQDTLVVAEDVLPALAESEPRIAAPSTASQNDLFGLKVLISKSGEVEEAVVLRTLAAWFTAHAVPV